MADDGGVAGGVVALAGDGHHDVAGRVGEVGLGVGDLIVGALLELLVAVLDYGLPLLLLAVVDQRDRAVGVEAELLARVLRVGLGLRLGQRLGGDGQRAGHGGGVVRGQVLLAGLHGDGRALDRGLRLRVGSRVRALDLGVGDGYDRGAVGLDQALDLELALVALADGERLLGAAVGDGLGVANGQRGRGDLNRHIFGCEVRIARTGCLSSHGHLAIGDVLHARGRGRPLTVTNLIVNGVAIGGRAQRSDREVILGIVGPGAARQGELSTLHSGGLDLEVALFHSHDVVVVGGVVGIQHIFIGAYGLIFVCALIGHGSKIVIVREPRYGASEGGIFLIKELLGAVHRDGDLARSNLEIVRRRQFRQVIGGGPCGFHLVRAGVGGLGADPLAIDQISVGGRAEKRRGRAVGLGHGSLFGLRRIAICPVVKLHAGLETGSCRFLDLQPAVRHGDGHIVVANLVAGRLEALLRKPHVVGAHVRSLGHRSNLGACCNAGGSGHVDNAHALGVEVGLALDGEAGDALLLSVIGLGVGCALDADGQRSLRDLQPAVDDLVDDVGVVLRGSDGEAVLIKAHHILVGVGTLGLGGFPSNKGDGALRDGDCGAVGDRHCEPADALRLTVVGHGVRVTFDNYVPLDRIDDDLRRGRELDAEGVAPRDDLDRDLTSIGNAQALAVVLDGDVEVLVGGEAEHGYARLADVELMRLAIIGVPLVLGVDLGPRTVEGVALPLLDLVVDVDLLARADLGALAIRLGEPADELIAIGIGAGSGRGMRHVVLQRLGRDGDAIIVGHVVEGGDDVLRAEVRRQHDLAVLGGRHRDALARIIDLSVGADPVEELVVGVIAIEAGSVEDDGVGSAAIGVRVLHGALVTVLEYVLDLDASLRDPVGVIDAPDDNRILGVEHGSVRSLPATENVAVLHRAVGTSDLAAVLHVLVLLDDLIAVAELDRVLLRRVASVDRQIFVGHRGRCEVELGCQTRIGVPAVKLLALGSGRRRVVRERREGRGVLHITDRLIDTVASAILK